MICDVCKKDNEKLYELAECKACENCWLEYWQSNGIGMDTSFTDFLEFTCTEVEDVEALESEVEE